MRSSQHLTPFGASLLAFFVVAIMPSGSARAVEAFDPAWQKVSEDSRAGVERVVYVEARQNPGRPAFRIETSFDVSPIVAVATLMEEMLASGAATTAGETRRVMERSERGALVHTLIDLPFLFADRELAIRIEHTHDEKTGVQRVDWVDANDVLPPANKGVLRLSTRGYWEFRPAASGRTEATYMSRAEVGGSLPAALSSRLMKGQALTAVERLGTLLADRGRIHVAGPPPGILPLGISSPATNGSPESAATRDFVPARSESHEAARANPSP